MIRSPFSFLATKHRKTIGLGKWLFRFLAYFFPLHYFKECVMSKRSIMSVLVAVSVFATMFGSARADLIVNGGMSFSGGDSYEGNAYIGGTPQRLGQWNRDGLEYVNQRYSSRPTTHLQLHIILFCCSNRLHGGHLSVRDGQHKRHGDFGVAGGEPQ